MLTLFHIRSRRRAYLEFLREIGHLRPRTNTFGAVFRVRNILAEAVHDFSRAADSYGSIRRSLLQATVKGPRFITVNRLIYKAAERR